MWLAETERAATRVEKAPAATERVLRAVVAPAVEVQWDAEDSAAVATERVTLVAAGLEAAVAARQAVCRGA